MTSIRFSSCQMELDDEENLDYEIISFTSRAFCTDDEFQGRPQANTHGIDICTPREEKLMIHLVKPSQIRSQFPPLMKENFPRTPKIMPFLDLSLCLIL
jgi:hypothetical protein